MLATLHTFGADLDARTVRKRSPLKIGVLAKHSRRVELGSTNAVRVATGHDSSFIACWTDFCHIFVVFL